MAGRDELLGRPKQVAEVITRGASERVHVRNRGGHQGGHAQNVQECGAVCAQICTESRKCPGDTFGDREHLCRIRRRSPPGQTHGELHDGVAGSARTHRRGEMPPTFQPVADGRQSFMGGEPERAGGCTRVRCAQRAPTGARGWVTVRQDESRRARGACRCSAATGRHRGVRVQKWHETQRQGGGVAAMGAGVTLLALARVVVGACRAPRGTSRQQVAWTGEEGAMGWERGETAPGWKMQGR